MIGKTWHLHLRTIWSRLCALAPRNAPLGYALECLQRVSIGWRFLGSQRQASHSQHFACKCPSRSRKHSFRLGKEIMVQNGNAATRIRVLVSRIGSCKCTMRGLKQAHVGCSANASILEIGFARQLGPQGRRKCQYHIQCILIAKDELPIGVLGCFLVQYPPHGSRIRLAFAWLRVSFRIARRVASALREVERQHAAVHAFGRRVRPTIRCLVWSSRPGISLRVELTLLLRGVHALGLRSRSSPQAKQSLLSWKHNGIRV